MSIELPEAGILAKQMNEELRGKRVKATCLKDYEKLQKLGFINKDIKSFDRLVGGKIESVASRGSVIRVRLGNGMNLILAPEYGGVILYHTSEETLPGRFHLKVEFSDSTAVTVRLTCMGVINALENDELDRSYVYRRDFSDVPSPVDADEFTFKRFSDLLANRNLALKSVLVGKDAIVVGLGNSSFQDIVYQAKLHPKRRAAELSKDERRALYEAIRRMLDERIQHGGKDQFLDLYGERGRYVAAMGPHKKQQTCSSCGTPIETLSLGGGQTYYCPKCQK